MSSYRPKSLDELNSRYDQAMSADLAIKKGVSGIRESETFQKEKSAVTDFDSVGSEAEALSKKVASAKNVEDISGAVDDFIRHLNSEYLPDSLSKNRPQPSRVMNPRPVSHAVPQPQAHTAPQSETSTVDRSELLEDYMKVMTDQYEDEDDDSEPFPVGSYLRKKSRKRRKDKTAQPVEDAQPSAPLSQNEPMPLPEVNYNDSAYMKNAADNAAAVPSEEAPLSNPPHEAAESLASTFDRLDEQAEKPAKKKKGAARIVFRTIFSLLLAAVLVFTAAVASLVLVLKVNTGNLALDKYYFVTTTADFEEADLQKGDLVVCETGTDIEDGSFVLCVDRNAGSFFFGKKAGGVVDDQGNIMYLVDGQNIYKESVLGTVRKSIDHIGSVIDFVFRYYIPVLSALLVLAIGLILIVAVALRNKNKNGTEPSDEDDRDGEPTEEDDSQAEQPEDEAPEALPADEEPVSEDREPMTGELQPEQDEAEPDEQTQQAESDFVPERKSRKKDRKKKNKMNKNRSQTQDEAVDTVEDGGEDSAEETEDSYGSDYDSFSDI